MLFRTIAAALVLTLLQAAAPAPVRRVAITIDDGPVVNEMTALFDMVAPSTLRAGSPSKVNVRSGRSAVVRCSPYRSSGVNESSRPFCMANNVAVDRVEAPIFT